MRSSKTCCVALVGLFLSVSLTAYADEAELKMKQFMKLETSDGLLSGSSNNFRYPGWFDVKEYRWSVAKVGNTPVYELKINAAYDPVLVAFIESTVSSRRSFKKLTIDSGSYGANPLPQMVKLECEQPKVIAFNSFTQATDITAEFTVRCQLLNWEFRGQDERGVRTSVKSELFIDNYAWPR